MKNWIDINVLHVDSAVLGRLQIVQPMEYSALVVVKILHENESTRCVPSVVALTKQNIIPLVLG